MIEITILFQIIMQVALRFEIKSFKKKLTRKFRVRPNLMFVLIRDIVQQEQAIILQCKCDY